MIVAGRSSRLVSARTAVVSPHKVTLTAVTLNTCVVVQLPERPTAGCWSYSLEGRCRDGRVRHRNDSPESQGQEKDAGRQKALEL